MLGNVYQSQVSLHQLASAVSSLKLVRLSGSQTQSRRRSCHQPKDKAECSASLSSFPDLPSNISCRELNPLIGRIQKKSDILRAGVLPSVPSVSVRRLAETLLQRPQFQHLIYQQLRAFKTRRSESSGLHNITGSTGSDHRSNTNEAGVASSTVNRQGQMGELLHQFDTSPQIQNKLKLAFAEGYAANERKAPADGDSTKSTASKVFRFLYYGIVIYFVIQIINIFSAVGGGGGVRGLGIMQRENFEVNPEEITINFSDVKGVDEAKRELSDIVEFLRDPEKFTTLGASLPKGVLLVGPPGIGKTLLARAVAGEAGVPFFHASGSEFDEIFVGTGAKRVRQMFAAARVKAPCVIFIDEIDSVGAKRTSSQIHPYANQTINQLLAEMDGFTASEGVIVLGATNRRDNLDKALLRPGRFDVEVRVYPPDLQGRTQILSHYLSKMQCSPLLDVDALARATTGFTGADLKNMVNQAALRAAMDSQPLVEMEHLEYARDKILMGPAMKSRVPDEETNWNTSYHEAGHAIVSYFTKAATPIHKVTIVPRGMSLGHTSFLPDKEQYGVTRAQLMARMDVAMGGRVAEELMLGHEKVTTGASGDFQSATAIATQMVKQYGMSDKVGVRVFEGGDAVDSGLSMVKVNDVSPGTTEQIDAEIKRLLQESYERAKSILRTHSVEHKALAKALMKHETLDASQVRAVIEGKQIPLKS